MTQSKMFDEAMPQAVSSRWADTHEPEMQWIARNESSFDFAKSMRVAVGRFGSLTDNQLAAIRKCMAREVAKQAAQAQPQVNVAGAGFSRMAIAFDAAKTSGLKYPKFIVGSFVFSLAGAASRNAGHVYVKRQGTYIGKISATGDFHASGDATAQDHIDLADICRDPLAAAVAHGQKTGRCSCCGRELTKGESVERGIGPICAEKWGL